MIAVLERWNGLDAEAAKGEILPCCGSHGWAREMVERRPLRNADAVLAASDAAWAGVAEADRMEAFASHPRIGQRHAAGIATERSLAWSAGEQSAVLSDGPTTARELEEANRAYEARFGRTFLVCASGRSGGEILELLRQRMGNDPEAELREAVEQQRQITRLRLLRWMEGR